MMKRFACGAASLALAGALALSLGSCAKPASSSSATSQSSASSQGSDQSSVAERTEKTANDGGNIDATSTGSKVATFFGPKYIVSDATVNQSVDQSGEDLGHQEICVVDQPQSWERIASIGWDRNSITFMQVERPWGSAVYRYEYLNEAGANAETAARGRTTEEAFFAGAGEVSHTEVNGHEIAYVYLGQSVVGPGGEGMVDLEAEAAGVNVAASGRTAMVYAYEQRADKCSFVVTATCMVANGADTPSAEQILQDVYAPIGFVDKDARVEAASYLSDVSISNADSTANVVIARDGDSLVSYTEHSVVLLGAIDTGSTAPTVTYDFELAGEQEGMEEFEVGGHRVRAAVSESKWEFETETVVERTLNAYVDLDGATLHVSATLAEGEEVPAALERLVGSRLK